ncbi:MAG: hypothetical protein HC929_09785 [Leptolyngbyaceae cyanobacterium SM2_5_2]|nr:hypothetical protein [Leptolyngbyaceae cyanobacterium SM2_5_2]
MPSTSLPNNWRLLLAGYVLDDLTPEETAQVEQWLVDHPETVVELETLQATWDSWPESLPPQPLPHYLRHQVMAAVEATSEATSAVPQPSPTETPPVSLAGLSSPRAHPAAEPRFTPRRFPWGKVGLGLGWAATALALMTVRQENQRLRLALRQNEALVASFSQPGNPLFTLAGAEAEPQASGRLLVNPGTQTALIITADLPPLEADQVYRLWAVAARDPIFCGQFNPDTSEATTELALPDRACSTGNVQMLVTAERAADPPVPAGSLVLQSQS